MGEAARRIELESHASQRGEVQKNAEDTARRIQALAHGENAYASVDLSFSLFGKILNLAERVAGHSVNIDKEGLKRMRILAERLEAALPYIKTLREKGAELETLIEGIDDTEQINRGIVLIQTAQQLRGELASLKKGDAEMGDNVVPVEIALDNMISKLKQSKTGGSVAVVDIEALLAKDSSLNKAIEKAVQARPVDAERDDSEAINDGNGNAVVLPPEPVQQYGAIVPPPAGEVFVSVEDFFVQDERGSGASAPEDGSTLVDRVTEDSYDPALYDDNYREDIERINLGDWDDDKTEVEGLPAGLSSEYDEDADAA